MKKERRVASFYFFCQCCAAFFCFFNLHEILRLPLRSTLRLFLLLSLCLSLSKKRAPIKRGMRHKTYSRAKSRKLKSPHSMRTFTKLNVCLSDHLMQNLFEKNQIRSKFPQIKTPGKWLRYLDAQALLVIGCIKSHSNAHMFYDLIRLSVVTDSYVSPILFFLSFFWNINLKEKIVV